jgi:hypothetical protein
MDRFIVRTPRLKPSLPAPSRSDQDLPDPNSFDDPEIAFEANEAVKSALSLSSSRKRQSYNKQSEEVRIKIGKYAAENGVENAVRKYRSSVDGLKQTTVSNWKRQYKSSLNGGSFSSPHQGRPVALGDEVDKQIRQHLLRLREEGAPVSNAIVLAVARTYLKRIDLCRYQLGGEQMLTRALSQSILRPMNFVRRKVTKAAKKLPVDFDQLCSRFYSKIQALVCKHVVPDDLIVN